MKSFKCFLAIISIPFFVNAEELSIGIDDVIDNVSNRNYVIRENAERLYQRKENIKFARNSLLPNLNLWSMLRIPAVIIDPLSIGDIIQDVAPFLVPANWFRARQAELIFRVEEEQYRALWANEVSTAKLLFLSAYRNLAFKDILQDKVEKYRDILEIARTRNIFGVNNYFSYNIIQDRYLALLEDLRNLNNLTFSEVRELQFLVGIQGDHDLSLDEPPLPRISENKVITYPEVIFKVLDSSPEIKQYELLQRALPQIRHEIRFNILGTSSYSLGEGNGAFDHVPIQDGLGFGNSASVNITNAEERTLDIQQQAVTEILSRQARIFVNEYNSLISNYSNTQERFTLAESNYNSLFVHLRIGGEVEALSMIEILDNLFSAKLQALGYEYRFAQLTEKLKRMTFSGDYSQVPSYEEALVIGVRNE